MDKRSMNTEDTGEKRMCDNERSFFHRLRRYSFEDLNCIEKLTGKLRNLPPKGNDNLNDT
jgi:hypothetical protein